MPDVTPKTDPNGATGHVEQSNAERSLSFRDLAGDPKGETHSHVWIDGEFFLNGCSFPHEVQDAKTE